MVNRIREARKRKGLTMKELGNRLGLAESTISQYETGKREPDNETLLKIGEILGVSVGYLLGEDIASQNIIPCLPSHKAPIVGVIPAGYPIFAQEDIEGYADIPYTDEENYFFLRVSGNSMEPMIHTGDLVLIRKQRYAEDNQIIAARVNGDEATLKRYRRCGDKVFLLPENPSYDPYVVSVGDFDIGEASIIGIALETRHKL